MCLFLTDTKECNLWQRAQTSPSCQAKVTGTGIRFVLTPPHPVAKISSRAWWQVTWTLSKKTSSCWEHSGLTAAAVNSHKPNTQIEQSIKVRAEEHKLQMQSESRIQIEMRRKKRSMKSTAHTHPVVSTTHASTGQHCMVKSLWIWPFIKRSHKETLCIVQFYLSFEPHQAIKQAI